MNDRLREADFLYFPSCVRVVVFLAVNATIILQVIIKNIIEDEIIPISK